MDGVPRASPNGEKRVYVCARARMRHRDTTGSGCGPPGQKMTLYHRHIVAQGRASSMSSRNHHSLRDTPVPPVPHRTAPHRPVVRSRGRTQPQSTRKKHVPVDLDTAISLGRHRPRTSVSVPDSLVSDGHHQSHIHVHGFGAQTTCTHRLKFVNRVRSLTIPSRGCGRNLGPWA